MFNIRYHVSYTVIQGQWMRSLDFLCTWTASTLTTQLKLANTNKQITENYCIGKCMCEHPITQAHCAGFWTMRHFRETTKMPWVCAIKTWTCNWFHQSFLKPHLIQCCKSQMIYELNCYEPEEGNANFNTGKWPINVDGEKALALILFVIT